MMHEQRLVITVLLITLVLLVFALSSCAGGENFSDIFSVEYSTDEFEITENFDSIIFDVDTADIKLAVSDDDACHFVVYSHEKIKYGATVRDGELTVSVSDERAWYDYILLRTDAAKLTLYLPRAEYDGLVINSTTGDVEIPSGFTFRTAEILLTTGDVDILSSVTGLAKIETTSGDINLADMSAASIDVSLTTGDVSLENVSCEGNIALNIGTGETDFTNVTCYNLTSDGTTGSVSLVDVVAEGKITLERTTGDISFDRCDAAELFVNTSTGDVLGTLLTPKIFIAKTTTGKIELPDTTTGGICKITTTTGDIIIDIAE